MSRQNRIVAVSPLAEHNVFQICDTLTYLATLPFIILLDAMPKMMSSKYVAGKIIKFLKMIMSILELAKI